MSPAIRLPLLAGLGLASGIAGWIAQAKTGKLFTPATLGFGSFDIPSLFPGLVFALAVCLAGLIAGSRRPFGSAAAAVVVFAAWPVAFVLGLIVAGWAGQGLRATVPQAPTREAIGLAVGLFAGNVVGGLPTLLGHRLAAGRPIAFLPGIALLLIGGAAVACLAWVLRGSGPEGLMLVVMPLWQAIYLVGLPLAEISEPFAGEPAEPD